MNTLHLPWLEIAVLLPLVGAVITHFMTQSDTARKVAVVASALTLLAASAAWLDFYSLRTFEAHDSWDLLETLTNIDVLIVDELSAPLLPMTAIIYFLTILTTQRTKANRFSFSWTLVSLSLAMATFSCRLPWGVITLLILSAGIPLLELRRREKPTGAYLFHMVVMAILLVFGQLILQWQGDQGAPSLIAVLALMGAVLIRSGVFPLHCWMTDLVEHATFGTSIITFTPMAGAYAAFRLVLPIAPDWALRSIVVISLTTALYAVGMALVQRDSRRFFCFLLLSQSSLVLVGLEMSTPMGLTGSLCVWLTIGLAMTGLGLIIRSLEARSGRLNLTDYHGLYEHVPSFAAFYLVTGLASVGFPGTIGFVSLELLIEGTSQRGVLIGTIVILASALCGIAIMHGYFHIFTGKHHRTSISLASRGSERFAYLLLVSLIVIGGIVPQPSVSTRYHAAIELLRHRDPDINKPEPQVTENQIFSNNPSHR